MIELPVNVFDSYHQIWIEGTPGSGGAECESLSVATFNIWFDSYHQHRRQQAIFDILERENPDLIALQEVTSESLELIRRRSFFRRGFYISDIHGKRLGGYGNVVLSRHPVSKFALIPFASAMGRKLLLCEIRMGDRELAFGAVHLESQRPNRLRRESQLAHATDTLGTYEWAILAGDFNFCHRHPENEMIPPEFCDAWPFLEPDHPGYTEDTAINKMRLMAKRKERQARFDRILSKGTLKPTAIKLLGTEPLSSDEPTLFPSDHFGLLAEFVIG